jgi:hypothetical protein
MVPELGTIVNQLVFNGFAGSYCQSAGSQAGTLVLRLSQVLPVWSQLVGSGMPVEPVAKY